MIILCLNSRATMLVTILLRNGWTDLYEILCAYWVGLRIGQHLFIIKKKSEAVRSSPGQLHNDIKIIFSSKLRAKYYLYIVV